MDTRDGDQQVETLYALLIYIVFLTTLAELRLPLFTVQYGHVLSTSLNKIRCLMESVWKMVAGLFVDQTCTMCCAYMKIIAFTLFEMNTTCSIPLILKKNFNHKLSLTAWSVACRYLFIHRELSLTGGLMEKQVMMILLHSHQVQACLLAATRQHEGGGGRAPKCWQDSSDCQTERRRIYQLNSNQGFGGLHNINAYTVVMEFFVIKVFRSLLPLRN